MSIVAIAQMRPELLDVASNLDKTLRMMSKATKESAKVVIFPELALTGCCLTFEEAQSVAEPIPGPITDRIVDHCRELDILSVVCMIEAGQNHSYFNTAILAGPGGILSRYRKTHLPSLGVDRFLQQGDEIMSPIDTSIGSLGMLICWDMFFPEAARVLALSGVQAILAPTAWLSSNDPTLEFFRIRAVENSVYVFWANRVGEERGLQFSGRSGVASPDGEILARASSAEEEILCVDIDPTKAKKGKLSEDYEMSVLQERRPELYTKLIDFEQD